MLELYRLRLRRFFVSEEPAGRGAAANSLRFELGPFVLVRFGWLSISVMVRGGGGPRGSR